MKQKMPNILWIGVDEQNIRTIGVYGSKNCKTPFLDRLAGQSLVFENAFCPTAVCSPSRASMLTGRMPSEGSVVANDLLTWTIPSRDASRVRIMKTWADSLRNRRYRTVHVGKWHLTGAEDDKPRDYGFEGTNYGGFGKNWGEPEYHAYRRALGLYPKPELELEIYSKHPVPYEFDPKSARLKGPEEGSLPAFLASRTISWLEKLAVESKSSGRPFFLRCEFWGPHMPCYAPEPYYSMYDPAGLELPDNFNRLGEGKPEIHRNFSGYWGIATHPIEIQRKYIAAYMAYATCIDRQVGRILDSLEASGLSDDTVVFFTSDHGDMLGALGLYDNGPFMYEEIYRVPLMVRWPGIATPGR
ncbi:MAG TPA: sulfatase-like hydrolase/transferase, partial [Spirochaetia bacterium]|nr:sulfatase-like hydrolase/transferase [Spirochaetia bacterium]